MIVKPIQVTPQEVIIPLTYFPNAAELELIIVEDTAVVRAKTDGPQLHQHKRQAEMLAQAAAFEGQQKELQQYLGEYVAFHQGELVDRDPDRRALSRRIRTNYPGQIVLIRQVTAQPVPPLRLGSPRLNH
jgi:hypothetical protein